MRLAVFTPFVRDSAIARVTNEVFTELNTNHGIEVTIFTSHTKDLIESDLCVVIFNINDLDKNILSGYDLCVYVLGNHLDYHRDCYLASLLNPGILILHDRTMSNFWLQALYFDADFSETRPEKWKHEKNLLFGRLPEYHSLKWEEFIRNYDFLKMPYSVSYRPFLQNATGVYTHSGAYAGHIKENYNFPVGFSYIPVICQKSGNTADLHVINDILQKARDKGRKIIVSTGMVHSIKRIDKVTNVLLKNDELREKVCYILIGENGGDYCARLIKHSEYKLRDSLVLLGRQSDEVMFHAINEADLCINLRYPNSEVCSLSLLEQMACKKAVMVLDTGIYDEMPDDTVIKIKPDKAGYLSPESNRISGDQAAEYRDLPGESDAIEDVLLKLVHNDIDTKGIGERAARFIGENASKEVYAKGFKEFLTLLPKNQANKEIREKFLSAVSERSGNLFEAFGEIPYYTNNITFNINRLFNTPEKSDFNKKKLTLGIWYTFPAMVPALDREGISIFTGKLCEAFVRCYDINLEVWVYSWNLEPVKRVFANIPSGKIKIVTEKTYAGVLGAESYLAREIGDLGEHNYWRLTEAARMFSTADIFMPAIIYLDDVVYTGKPVVAVIHDLFAVYLREMYKSIEHGHEIYLDTIERVTNLARRNAHFAIDTESTFVNQVIPYIKNLNISNTTIINMPKNTPANIEYISRSEVYELLGTEDPYLFYPTQVRLHKNFNLLISAFAILLKKNPSLKLVLTGVLEDVPEVWQLSKDLNTEQSIINTGRLTTAQLFSLYKYAKCTPVSSMHEAALSLQAVEAMCTGTPVVFTDAEINRDEIEKAGFIDVIPLIPGNDPEGFANEIEYAMNNREAAVKRQEPLLDVLTAYTWEDAAKKYYELFLKVLSEV